MRAGRVHLAADCALCVAALGVHAPADTARFVLVRRARVHLSAHVAFGVMAVLVHFAADAAFDVTAIGREPVCYGTL